MGLRRQLGVLTVVCGLLVGLLVPQAATAAPSPPPVEKTGAPTHHTSVGGVTVNQLPGHGFVEGHATNDPSVTVGIPVPADDTSQVRLSNDGVTWVVRPLAASVAWDLTDPAAGGDPSDGPKTVTVEYGDGVTWRPAGSDYLYLDRVGPVWDNFALENGAASVASWNPNPTGNQSDPSGLTGMRMSLDGVRWGDWGERIDLRSIDYGGSWAPGLRTLYFQLRDGAENVSEYSDSIEVTYPPLGPDEGTVPVQFEFPRPAVTGSLFTIRPVFPAGFTMPSNAWCNWYFHWGDDQSIYDLPNENYGELAFERKASAGGCVEWTFTLPYNPGRRFDLQFSLLTKTPAQEDDWGMGTPLYSAAAQRILGFTAAIGTTDRHIYQSTIPIVYLLPDATTLTQQGDPVTYRLYASGGTAIPQTGTFWTYPMSCYINPMWHKDGGTSFTYTPNCNGNWVTGWTGTYKGGFMRSQYDPVVDGKAPVVGSPVVRIDPRAVGTSAPITVSYSGRDSASGLYKFQLERSVNGGTWRSVALPSRLTQTVHTSLSLTATTRYRVRARDRVGNWSSWHYGPRIKGSALQEWNSSIKWSPGWTRQSSTAWMGGAARLSTNAGATASFVFTGRNVGWVGRRGPDLGLVRVWVDGKVAATVDLRASTIGSRAVVWAQRWAIVGTHSVRLENLGTEGSPGVVVDAFFVVK